jgi:hypothetical protein
MTAVCTKPCSRGSLHVSIWIGIDPEGAALFFTRNKVPANGNCCSPCIRKELLSFSRGSMAGKMALSMDECSRPVRLTSRIEEIQNLTSQSRVFSVNTSEIRWGSPQELHLSASCFSNDNTYRSWLWYQSKTIYEHKYYM